MTKTLDILFKIFAVLWFGIVGFSIVIIAYYLVFESNESIETEPVAVVICFSISAVIAFIFSTGSWKFYTKNYTAELLLDDIEIESELKNVKDFKEYEGKCFLAILLGISSMIFGLWFYYTLVKEVGDTLRFTIFISAVIVFCLFGLLLLQRAVDIWLKISVCKRIEDSERQNHL